MDTYAFEADKDGIAQCLTLHVDATQGAGAVLRVGVFDDVGGSPHALLAKVELPASTSGDSSGVLDEPVAIVAGKTYWIWTVPSQGFVFIQSVQNACSGQPGMESMGTNGMPTSFRDDADHASYCKLVATLSK